MDMEARPTPPKRPRTSLGSTGNISLPPTPARLAESTSANNLFEHHGDIGEESDDPAMIERAVRATIMNTPLPPQSPSVHQSTESENLFEMHRHYVDKYEYSRMHGYF